jgi:hypothetical protein
LPTTWEGRQKKYQITRDVERTYLLDNLYSGELWAIGYVTEPDGFDRPTRVPRELFFVNHDEKPEKQPHIDWSKGELIGHEVSYFDINVVRPLGQEETDNDEIKDQSFQTKEQESPPSKSRRGRPSTGSEIRAKVIELWEGSTFQKLPNRTAQAREVRAQMLGEGARDKDEHIGYKTSSIIRIIGKVAAQRSE